MLEVRGLTARYGGITALSDVSLEVSASGVVSLLGANGAGKSTLLGAIIGASDASVQGSIRLDGQEVLGRSVEEMVRRGVAMAPEGRQVFTDLTVEENLQMGAYLRRDGAVRSDLDRMFALFPRLLERRRQPAGTLSGGEQQMVAIGRALMARPRLLLLDEPSLGLAPLFVAQIMRLVTEIQGTGIAVMLVEQNARQALRISGYGYVLEKGRVALAGGAAALAADASVTAAYLGGH